MLTLVKLALRVTTTAFDAEIQTLIDACIAEMYGLGVTAATSDTTDAQIQTAVVAYCKWQFGDNSDADKWRSIYESKLGQLKMRTDYTDWGDE